MTGPGTHVYVDGFNLYYGALRNTPYRWLDLGAFCRLMLPRHEILSVKYFTALVKPRPDDQQQPVRQQTYIRALHTIPNCTVIYGHFLSHTVRMRLAKPSSEQPYAEVIKTEEKGSDVNIATHLLCDGFEDSYDTAVIVSNDSDLAGPVQMVTEKLGKAVGLLNPHRYPSRELSRHVRFLKRIRKGVLKASQFPDTLTDEHGPFHKPEDW